MSRGKVITLVALAVAVLLFDAWFFLGEGATAAPVQAPDVRGAPDPIDAPGEPLPGSAGTAAHAAVPWHDPSTWPLPERRPPRRGRLRPGLMVRSRPAPRAAATGSAPLPDRVPVILWRPEGALALLGSHLVREGDRVGPWVVREIHPDRVLLARADRPAEVRELPLGSPPRPHPVTTAGKPDRPRPTPASVTDPSTPPAPPAHEEVP